MKQKMNKGICCLLLLSLIFSGIHTTEAKEAEPKVQIYDTVQGNAEHRSIEMGQEKNNFSVKLSSGNIKKEEWKSSNERIVTVRRNYDGFVTVSAHDEGTAFIQVTVTTDTGKVLSDTCTISVYTKTTRTGGQLKTEADFFRAASTQSVVRRRGKEKQSFTIVASCETFYRVLLPDSYQFEDTLTHQYAYVFKSAVYVPVTKVELNHANLSLQKKSKKNLKASVLPDLAGNKEVEWESSNKKVAAISKGKVTAKGYGTAIITVKTKDKGKTATCKVTVKKKVEKATKTRKKTVKAKNLNINGKYLFRFDNSFSSFGTNAKYYMSKKDMDKLVDRLYRGGYQNKSRKKIKKAISKEIALHWEGSCYGMSVVTALNKGEKIHAKKYCGAKRGQPYTLRYLDLPKDNKRVMSLINYYQIGQSYASQYVIDCDSKKNWLRLIKNAKKNRLQLFSFWFYDEMDEEDDAHAILLKEYVKTKKNYVWIATYDPNSPHRKTYIKVNQKTGKFKSEDYENMNTCDFIDDFSIFNPIKIDRK